MNSATVDQSVAADNIFAFVWDGLLYCTLNLEQLMGARNRVIVPAHLATEAGRIDF